jgi:F-box and leucine-rich repeat protein 2/20
MEKMDLEECSLITDATIIHLAMNCARLEKLVSAQTIPEAVKKLTWVLFSQSLSHCELITDEGIRHLSTSQCAAENLTALELDNCPFITDASLDHLISCYNLQRIELYDCQLITRAGIRRLRVRFHKQL